MVNRDFERVETVFHAALDLPAEERRAYLAQACAGNDSLYAEVCSLVSALDASDGFIEEPALNLGLSVLSESESMTGKVIGSYKVLSRLGKGGMGEVYLAEDTKLGRKVALKFLSQELVNDNWAKRQLIKEAQAVAQLDHPNICSVFEFEDAGEHSFIVMQFIEGETLADLIRENQIHSEQVLAITLQMVAALAEAHAHGIIHRDVKPRNIMVTPDGQVHILDFGLAKTIRHKDGHEMVDRSISHLDRNGILAGTVAYMSPEQLRGERLDFRSDIFSLGTVLYELIEGQNPFLKASEAETISAILTSEPRPLKHPNGLARVIDRCLAKDRDRRYQSATELLIELSSNTKQRFDQWPGRYLRPWTIGTAAITLILATTLVIFLFFSRNGTSSSAEGAKNSTPAVPTHTYSLAIMPITSDSLVWNGDYITEGLTESLIHRFSSVSELRVMPYTSVSGYSNKTSDPTAVGRALKVDALLLGNIIKKGNKDVLQSKLIKVPDGSEIWSGDDEMKWDTILSVEDQIVTNVTQSLKVHLSNEKKFLESHGTSSPAAFRQYMLGRAYWKNRDKVTINKAIEHFRDAIRLDPLYARAHAGLADSYVLLSVVSFGKTPNEEAMSLAAAAAEEALTLDGSLPEAHTSLGVVNLRYKWDWITAEKEFKRSIELNDNYAPAHYWYSQLLLVTGRWPEAIAESEKAKNLDPFSPPTVMNSCRTLSLSRHLKEAVACYDKLLSENPTNDHAKYLRALLLQRAGRDEEALRTFQSLYATNRALAGAVLGYSYGKAGRISEAQKILAQMNELSKERYVPPLEFAIIYIGMGDRDNAFAWLEKAFNERFATLIYITVDPIFVSLRDDSRYQALIKRINLPPPLPE